MAARRNLLLLLLVVLGAVLFVKNSREPEGSGKENPLKTEDPNEDTDFVSDAEVDLTAAAIIQDLDREADEVLPDSLSSDIDSINLSEDEKMELEALLSPESPLGLVGVPVIDTKSRDAYEQQAPKIERVRSLSEQAVSQETRDVDARKIAEERKSGNIKELHRESNELEKKIEFAEEKKHRVKEEASMEKRDLEAVYVEEEKTIEAVQKLEKFKKESKDKQDVEVLRNVLESELSEKVSIAASRAAKLVDEKEREHAEVQKEKRDQIFENERRKEREIDLAGDPEKRGRLQRELVAEKQSALVDLRDLVKEQAREKKSVVEKSSNVIERVRDRVVEANEAKESEMRKRKRKERQELEDRHEASRTRAAKNHAEKVEAVEKFSGSLVQELESVARGHESKKEKVDRKVEDTKKRTPKARHPRKPKNKNSVKTTSEPLPNGSVEFTLEVPSDLTPGQTDSVDISVSKEENNSIREYRKVVEKIERDGTLKNVTREEKSVVAEAGRVFENVKQKYVKKRGEKVSRRASVIRETREKSRQD